MGYEYQIIFETRDIKGVEALLESLPSFVNIQNYNNRNYFNYRLKNNSGEMPNASALIEPNGIYFCDHGGSGLILKELIKKVTANYGQPQIIDYNN